MEQNNGRLGAVRNNKSIVLDKGKVFTFLLLSRRAVLKFKNSLLFFLGGGGWREEFIRAVLISHFHQYIEKMDRRNEIR